MKKRPSDASTASLRPKARATGHVLVIRNHDQLAIVPVTDKQVVVGRGADCGAQIDDDAISRAHARFRFGDAITVEDLGSRNGTVVGGQRLAPEQPRTIELGEPVTVAHVQIFVEPGRPPAKVPADGVVVRDPKMKQLYAVLDVIAATELRVLLLGETGVGKDVVARAIHARSRRAAKPYLAINCGAFPESMLEAELFGYEKGAFTGANQAKPGLFEATHGGTVLLDEVGELAPTTQVRLLRVLESGEVIRLGSVAPRRVDVRVIAATHRDLRAMIAAGQFRQDLYFRLDGTTLTIPPLRERVADIEPLARTFAAAMAASLGRTAPDLEPSAIAALEAHAWPGNIRELKNVVERAVALRAGSIRASDLTLDAPAPVPDADQPLWNELEQVERKRVIDALAAAAGNQTAAAKQLGIARTTLIRRIEYFGLVRPKKR